MNREETAEAIIVMQAYVGGERIQYRLRSGEPWLSWVGPSWDFVSYEYRIKPKAREYWIHPTSTKSCTDRNPGSAAGYFKVREVIDE